MTCVVFSSVIFLLLLAWLTFWEASPRKYKKNSQRLQLDEELVELDEPLEAAHVRREGIAVVGGDASLFGVEVDEEFGEDSEEGAGDADEGAVTVGAHSGRRVVLRREGGDAADLILVVPCSGREWGEFGHRI